MSNFTASMFDSIKESLESQKASGNGNFRDIMKTPVNKKPYVVRLVPNVEHADRTFHHYFQHGWNSKVTGQYMSALCPTTYGERCPVCEARMKLYQTNTEESKELARDLKRKENWLVNVFVQEDPNSSENEGQIKILRFGKQVDKIFTNAISGDEADEFGPKIFDLTENGCSFRIKVEENEGGYPTYVSSKFKNASKISGMDDDKIEEVHGGIFELDKLNESKSFDDLVEMLNDHFFVDEDQKVASAPVKETVEENVTDTESAPEEDKPAAEETESTPDADPVVDADADDDAEAKINELLADL